MLNVFHVQQEEPSGWEDSWRLSTLEDTADTPMTEINNVFLPGWRKSWLVSEVPLEEEEGVEKSWSSSWEYSQCIRCVIM